MTRPNIVYILADDMGYGDMGCNNPDSKIPTPNLDRLAAQGTRFTDAHAPTSVCTPSRYALLTGRYCWRSAMKGSVLWPWDGALIEEGRTTVADLLRASGYRTACIGKWHLGWNWQTKDGSPCHGGLGPGEFAREKRNELTANIDFTKPMSGGPIDRGFDTYFGDDVPNFPPYTWFEQDRLVAQPTETKPDEMFGWEGPMAPGWQLEGVMPELTRRAVDYIESADEQPFFLYFPLTAPHTPIVPLERFKGMSACGEYGDYVCEVDWCVGEVMAALERRGIADNTLLIFTSDNGPEQPAYVHAREFGHFSMAHFRGIKRDVWEGGHRIPFIARWPGVTPANRTCDQLITLGDFLATCAEVVGAPLPADAGEDSVSMLSLLRGGSKATREQAVHHSISGKFAIRRGDWVFIDAPSGGDNKEPDWFRELRGYEAHDQPGELFNLREDIAERTNHYADRPDLVAELTALLREIQGPDAPVAVDDAAQGPGTE